MDFSPVGKEASCEHNGWIGALFGTRKEGLYIRMGERMMHNTALVGYTSAYGLDFLIFGTWHKRYSAHWILFLFIARGLEHLSHLLRCAYRNNQTGSHIMLSWVVERPFQGLASNN